MFMLKAAWVTLPDTMKHIQESLCRYFQMPSTRLSFLESQICVDVLVVCPLLTLPFILNLQNLYTDVHSVQI